MYRLSFFFHKHKRNSNFLCISFAPCCTTFGNLFTPYFCYEFYLHERDIAITWDLQDLTSYYLSLILSHFPMQLTSNLNIYNKFPKSLRSTFGNRWGNHGKSVHLRIPHYTWKTDFSLRICVIEDFISVLVCISAHSWEKLASMRKYTKTEDFQILWGGVRLENVQKCE